MFNFDRMNQVRSKEELVSTIYKMLGSAAAFTLASATLVGQYVHDSVAHEAAKEVHNLIRLDKAGSSLFLLSLLFSL